MKDKATGELCRKLVRVVDELMKKHPTVTSVDGTVPGKTRMLSLIKGDTHAHLQMGDFYSSVQVKEEGSRPRYVSVRGQGELDLERFTEKQVDTLLDQLPKYKPTEGLHIPYGYVRNGVIAVIFVRIATGGKVYNVERYLLEGAELPSDALFGGTLSTEGWYDRFWGLMGIGKVVPMRKGRETSGWTLPGSHREPVLRRTDLTSNKDLLGPGKYRYLEQGK